MKYLISALLLTFSFAPLAARADIAPAPGTHEFSTHVQFDNLGDFPEINVYVSDHWRFGPSLTLAKPAVAPQGSIPTSGHPDSTLPPFYAVKLVNEKYIIHADDPSGERGDLWDILTENQKYLIKAEVTGEGAALPPEDFLNGNLKDTNPAVYIVWVYHIDELTDGSFKAHFVSESRYDKNSELVYGPALPTTVSTMPTVRSYGDDGLGAPKGIPYGDDGLGIEAPSKAAAVLPSGLIWIIIVCLGGVVLALTIKTWKK